MTIHVEKTRSPAPLTPPVPQPSAPDITTRLETEFNGKLLSPGAAEAARGYLAELYPNLVAGEAELTNALESKGFTVQADLYTSKEAGHPVIVLTALSKESGCYGLPNINLVLDAAAPEERGAGNGPKKITIAPSQEMQAEVPGSNVHSFSVERYSNEVRLIIEEPVSADVPYTLRPIFSPAAFSEATRNAAAVLRAGSAAYSYVLDELVLPAIRDEMRTRNGFVGAKERLCIEDNGTDSAGEMFATRTRLIGDPRSENIFEEHLVVVSQTESGPSARVVLP